MRGEPRFILDTNVISALAECTDKTLIRRIVPENGRVFVPYFVLQELLRGSPRNELRFLEGIGAELDSPLDSEQIAAISVIEELTFSACRLLIFGQSEGLSYQENLERYGFGSKQLNNLRPPGIVRSILRRLDGVPDGHEIIHFFEKHALELEISDLTTLQSLLLSLLGFWRDPLMLKSSPDLSNKGIMKQHQDAKLIGTAREFDCLVSSDKRLCRIAYAIYEFNSDETSVIYWSSGNNFDTLKVSPEGWSRLA